MLTNSVNPVVKSSQQQQQEQIKTAKNQQFLETEKKHCNKGNSLGNLRWFVSSVLLHLGGIQVNKLPTC